MNMPIAPDDSIARITELIFASAPQRMADVVIVLGAPNATAAHTAAEMFHAGLVRTIIVSGRGRGSDHTVPEWHLMRDALLNWDVPQDHVLIEPDATNTLENIQFSGRLIAERLGWSTVRDVALCCKPVHARRALMTAQSHFPQGVKIRVHAPRDAVDVQPDTWWQSEAGISRVMAEMSAIAEYTRKGDLHLTPLTVRAPKVHLVRIGGTGMSALANLYLDAGWSVSGSDTVEGETVQRLRARGAIITAKGIPPGVRHVVRSPAIPPTHADLIEARQSGLTVQTRTAGLTEFLSGREVISVAGSHGKSTTSTMLTTILSAALPDIGYMVGGVSDGLGRINARLGEGLFVAETCEAFRGLDMWTPAHCLLTNIDDEHSDHYGGMASLRTAFSALVARVPEDGAVILCGDDPWLSGIASRRGEYVVTYGIGDMNRVAPADVRMGPEGSDFTLIMDGVPLGRVSLPVPGLHNLLNALGALAMAVSLGIDPDQACAALSSFRPVQRRWQEICSARGVRVFDDFAHHPTEIEATLMLARQVAGAHAVHAVVQPQLISRATRMAPDYAAALSLADRVWRLPLDHTGEAGDPEQAERELDAALGLIPRVVTSVADPQACAAAVVGVLRPGDVVVCMGPALARQSAAHLAARLDAGPLPTSERDGARLLRHDAPDLPVTLLLDRFDAQVAARPEAICVVNETEGWTYARLDVEACRIARALAAWRIGPGDLVAVSLRKTLSFVAMLVGISKAGAAFVPIDPRMSRAGMGRALRLAGARLTLTDDPWRATKAGFDGAITLQDLLAAAESLPDRAPPTARPDDLAYGIFTSGSTGVPRLVGVEHRQVVSFFDQTLGKIFLPQDYRLVPCLASISFDAIINQVFCTLFQGGTLLMVDDIAALKRSVHFQRITLLGMPPSNLRLLLDIADIPATVHTLILGGEPTPPELLHRLRQVPTLRRVWNLYGPAEATLAVFSGSLLDLPETETGPDLRGHVIGHPLEAVAIRIVDNDGQPVALGQDGVLLIGGPTVARGYLGAADLTAERFLLDPDTTGQRWYRTGDILRQLSDGRYLFVGREDDQVKINGARIELGEVRGALLSCPGVTDATALVLTDKDARKSLIGYVILDAGTDLAFLRTWLRRHHAALLSPHRLMALDALPLQVNGKLDRRALIDLASAKQTLTQTAIDLTQADAAVLAIWRRVLRRSDLSATDDFREVGGDSLMAMEILLAAETELSVPLTGVSMDTLTTPAAMVAALQTVQPQPAPPDCDLLHRQRKYLAGWSGHGSRPDALIRTLPAKHDMEAGQGLFWVFQGDAEFTALHAAMGGLRSLHGMRSGHLIMDYTPETIDRLAEAYAEEICAIQPAGPLALGGNCQGAVIARASAFALLRRGREVAHLILMELSKFYRYDAPVDLIFGSDSTANPFRDGADPSRSLAEAYPDGVRVHFVTGAHGEFFLPRNVASLAAVLNDIQKRDATGP